MKSCLLPAVLLIFIQAPERADGIPHSLVKPWADKIGFELWQLGKYVTNIQKFHESYKDAKTAPRDGKNLVHDIANDIKTMMSLKISAIKRIMDVAEQSASEAKEEEIKDFSYVNAKNNSIELTYNAHFGGRVNTSMSAVHVPTNVYDGSKHVKKAIKWSEVLDKTFINNYEIDPSLSWQYFGSATGFMRQYPAISWDTKNVDLFDCRTRSWYIEAATSPKDMLILVDTSGSMTGMRKEIARHVVNNILDTLGNNDYVNIITFSNETKEVVKCFSNTLVQANLANIRELKSEITNLITEKIANFTLVLDQAFEMLQTYRENQDGARCNQAIMLVTDGVPDSFKEIFKFYNWASNPDNPEQADMPVRVFTYLIGREVADVRELKWMACANRGYFVHLSTLAEVREQVLNYIPVMARPLVLGRTDHPTIWTPVYADVTDPKMTDWLWEQEESAKQKERFTIYRKVKKIFSKMEEEEVYFSKRRSRKSQAYLKGYSYRLMTSVSMPVYDRRDNANITKEVLVKQAYWVTETRETRIADLLGVAGTDVPIEEIQKLMKPDMLGVNGYAFIVTNNGYLLIHPDLRPTFKGILKPSYNSVDMAEVELLDQDDEPRRFNDVMLKLRDEIMFQKNGSVMLHTKYHYDNMKRVGKMLRKYDYVAITNTPFTLVVSLPEYGHNGSYYVHGSEEVHLSVLKGIDVSKYFAGNNWRVHPDWPYCKYHYYEGEHNFNSPESELRHFLERAGNVGWKWPDKPFNNAPSNSSSGSESTSTKQNSYYCNRNLFQSLVYDAQVTQWFANISFAREEKGLLAKLMNLLPRQELQQRFGITVAFVATHSGLTRWQDFVADKDAPKSKEHFSNMHPKAIDEIWYKRAVEQYYIHPENFVYSVDVDEDGADNTTLVTASRAVFIGKDSEKAPVAVVGFQFLHSALQLLFQNITTTCDNCERHCGHDSIECYLIDNHGYILAAESEEDAGKFFGEVRGRIMRSMVQLGIYDEIRIYDYQAVCFKRTSNSNHGNKLLTPLKNLIAILYWMLDQVNLAWSKTSLWMSDEPEMESVDPETEDSDDYDENMDRNIPGMKDEKLFDQKVLINRTVPEPCDQQVNLYLLKNVPQKKFEFDSDVVNCSLPFVVQPVNYSNMLLVVVDVTCSNTNEPPLSVTPEDIVYGNNTLACQKAMNTLNRKRPESCIRSHPKESEIKDLCGFAPSVLPSWRTMLLTTFLSLSTWLISH